MKNVKEKNIIIKDSMDMVLDSTMSEMSTLLAEYIDELGLSLESPFVYGDLKNKSFVDVLNSALTDCKNAEEALDDSYMVRSAFSAILPYAQNMARMMYSENSSHTFKKLRAEGCSYSEVLFEYDALLEEVNNHETPELLFQPFNVYGRKDGWKVEFEYGSFINGIYTRGSKVVFIDGLSECGRLYTNKAINGEYELFIDNGIVFIMQHIMDTVEAAPEMDNRFFLRTGNTDAFAFSSVIARFKEYEAKGGNTKGKIKFLSGSKVSAMKKNGVQFATGEDLLAPIGDGIYAYSAKGATAGKWVKLTRVDEVAGGDVKKYLDTFVGDIIVDEVLFTTIVKENSKEVNSAILLCQKG